MPVRSLLRREESYALHALLLLAEEPGLSAAEVAAKLKAPPAFMAKVLSKLAKAGLVESRMGRTGGVWLRIPPAESLSGPVAIDLCATLKRCPTEERRGFCYLKPSLVRMNQEIRKTLAGFTLKDLLPETTKTA
ncbi:MAG: RrF2 family transcriptional regulator [Thermus sp.]